jgi:peptidoglycan/LPS O-acetylase OafA/YrhL
MRNDTITGLRGLLAVAVVVYHIYTGSVHEGILIADYLPSLVNLGSLAVNLFFAISGYLIFQSLKRHNSIGDFAVDRVIRIYPVFLVLHLIIFAIGPVINYKWLADLSVGGYFVHFFSNLLFLPGVFDLPIAQLVAWSLSYEAAFYLVMSLFFFFIRKQGGKRALLLIPVIMGACMVYFHPAALFFVVGIAVYLYKEQLKILASRKMFYFNGVIFLIVTFMLYSPQNIYVSMILGLLFFSTVANEQGLSSGILRTKVMQYLGNMSYSLYLWHTMVMFPIEKVVLYLKPLINSEPLLFMLYASASIIGSIIVSHFSYKLIEQKFARMIKDKLRRSKEKGLAVHLDDVVLTK